MGRSTTYVELAHPARGYTDTQLNRAIKIAWALGAHRLVLVAKPEDA
jgi:hypothetical protein